MVELKYFLKLMILSYKDGNPGTQILYHADEQVCTYKKIELYKLTKNLASKLVDNKITKEDLAGYGIEDLYYTAEVTYESGNNEQSKYSKKQV